MSYLLENPISLILTVLVVTVSLLYLREYNLRRKVQTEGDKFLQDIKEKGWQNLHTSIKKSQDMLGEAELEGIKVVADTRVEAKKFEEAARLRMTQLIASLEGLSQQNINQLFERLEQRLSDLLIQASQKTTETIELEIKSTRNLIEAYKQQQLKLIDENIIAMLEQTLAKVLSKKLSLKDQLDLVYEALEKAKVEKFIV